MPRHPQPGSYPILLGEPEEFETIQEGMEEGFDTAETLKASENIILPDWFKSKTESDLELYQTEEGDWPDEVEGEMGIITHLDIASGKPQKKSSSGY